MLKNQRLFRARQKEPSNLAKDQALKEALSLIRRLAFAANDGVAADEMAAVDEIVRFYLTRGYKLDQFYTPKMNIVDEIMSRRDATEAALAKVEELRAAKEAPNA